MSAKWGWTCYPLPMRIAQALDSRIWSKLSLVLLVGLVFGVTFSGTTTEAVAKEKEEDDAGGSGEEEVDDMWGEETTFSEAQVKRAIEKGIAWLTKKQKRDGSWARSRATRSMAAAKTMVSAVATSILLDQPRSGSTHCSSARFRSGTSRSRRAFATSRTTTSRSLRRLRSRDTPARRDGDRRQQEDEQGQRHDAARGRIKLKGKYRGMANKLAKYIAEDCRHAGAKGWRYHINDTPAPGGPADLSSTQLCRTCTLRGQPRGHQGETQGLGRHP